MSKHVGVYIIYRDKFVIHICALVRCNKPNPDKYFIFTLQTKKWTFINIIHRRFSVTPVTTISVSLMRGYGKHKFPEGKKNLIGMSNMSTKPTSSDKDMWICYTIDAVNILDVSATCCGHFQGGVFRRLWYKYHQNQFHCFTMHFNSLYIMVQLMHLFVLKH
jgi:hypothetical protein